MSDFIKNKKNSELYDKISDLPEHLMGQIINNELVVLKVSPTPRHSYSCSALMSKLSNKFDKNTSNGWWILPKTEVYLSNQLLVPYMAGWKKNKMKHLPDENYISKAPDWVCEFISPQSSYYDRFVKIKLYAQLKIPFYWIVDPQAKTLEVFALEGERWILNSSFGKDDKVSAEPFDAIEFDLGDLWAD